MWPTPAETARDRLRRASRCCRACDLFGGTPADSATSSSPPVQTSTPRPSSSPSAAPPGSRTPSRRRTPGRRATNASRYITHRERTSSSSQTLHAACRNWRPDPARPAGRGSARRRIAGRRAARSRVQRVQVRRAAGGWSAGSTSPWRGPAGCATRLIGIAATSTPGLQAGEDAAARPPLECQCDMYLQAVRKSQAGTCTTWRATAAGHAVAARGGFRYLAGVRRRTAGHRCWHPVLQGGGGCQAVPFVLHGRRTDGWARRSRAAQAGRARSAPRPPATVFRCRHSILS